MIYERLKKILKDVHDAGFKKIILITDRGYEAIENLEALINSEQELLILTKVSQRFIIDKIEQHETFPHHPKTMKLDINRKIYYEQLNIEYNDINKKS